MKSFAHLEQSCPFYSIFERGQVPITNFLAPIQADCEGDGIQPVYMIDLAKLTPGQLEKILDVLTAQCPHRREEARQDIAMIGLPLRAKHVSGTSSDSMFFL